MPPSDGGPTRANPAWLLLVAGVLLVARVGLGIWDATNPESRPDLVTWTAASSAAGEARARGRLVLYAFTDRDAPASRKLSSGLFTEAAIARELMAQFVVVRIEGPAADDTPETAALRGKFQVTELPALVVATADGGKFKKIAGVESPRAALEQLTTARLELMDLPFHTRGGVRFQIGGARGGDADSSAAGGTATP